MSTGHVSVFCQNLGITTFTLENYFHFKKEKYKFYWDIWNNNLLNRKFAGMDKYRLRTSLGKIKEMCVKMNKTKKVREMKVA